MQHHAEHRSSRLPDLVRDSQLATRFLGAGSTKHTIYVTPSQSTRRSRVRAEQIWQRERKLGNGTFGHVWLERCASGPTSGSVRAVKEMPKDSSLPVNYLRELEAMAKFSHEKYVHCFVKCFGWYMSESMVFIAMEHLEHGDLQKHLNQPFPEEQAKDIISQLTEGLMYMHDNGFAHRDLKPANILVHHPSPNWWVKIGDFGISKRAEEGNTALRTLIGTEGYLAPEVLGFVFDKESEASGSSSFSYTFAVDIWALGELTFRMVTKVPAFPNRQDLFNCVVRGHPFPVPVLEAAGVSPSCCDFVIKSMVGDPSKRMTAREASTHDWIRVSRPSSASSSTSSQVMSQVTTTTSSTSFAKTTDSVVTPWVSDPTFQYESTAQWSTGVPGSRLVQTEPQQSGASQETQKVTDDQPSSAPTTTQPPWFQATADWTAIPRTGSTGPPKSSVLVPEELRTAFISKSTSDLKPFRNPLKEAENVQDSPAVTASKPEATPGPSDDATLRPFIAAKPGMTSKEYADWIWGVTNSQKEEKLRQLLEKPGEATAKNPKPPATPESAEAMVTRIRQKERKKKLSDKAKVEKIRLEAAVSEKDKSEAGPSAASSSKAPAGPGIPAEFTSGPKQAPVLDPRLQTSYGIERQGNPVRFTFRHKEQFSTQKAKEDPLAIFNRALALSKSQEPLSLAKNQEAPAKSQDEAPRSENQKVEFVTALFSYVAQASGDLNFEKGDIIRVMKRTVVDNDWWRGELRREQGIFPANYCTPVTTISTTMACEGPKIPPCFLHKEVRSAHTSKAVAVEFVNLTASGIKTLWIKWDGAAVFYTTILAGKKVQQGTYVGHVWRLVDASTGETRAVYSAPNQDKDTVIIQGPGTVSVPRYTLSNV